MRDRPQVSDELRAELRSVLPEDIHRCMALFNGIKIEETRECLLATLRRLSDPEAESEFRSIFHYTHVYWDVISPDECLHPLRFKYAWLCTISLALDRRERRGNYT